METDEIEIKLSVPDCLIIISTLFTIKKHKLMDYDTYKLVHFFDSQMNRNWQEQTIKLPFFDACVLLSGLICFYTYEIKTVILWNVIENFQFQLLKNYTPGQLQNALDQLQMHNLLNPL